MATPKLDQHVLQEAVDVFAKYGEQAKAAAVLGLPTNTYKDRLRRAQQQGVKPSAGVEDAANIEHIRAKLRRTELELKVARGKALDEQAIRDGIFKLVQSVEKITTPSWLLRPRDSNASPGVPTLFLSDLHWGEVVKASQINGVNTYNVKIATARLRAAVEVAVYLLRKLSPKMDYDGIVCPLGGDMISGNIHDELTATNEFNTMPTILDLYGVLVWAIETLLEHFPRIFLPCVTGNHGRDTHKIWNKDRHATSFDWLLYNMLAKRFEADKRVTFFIPDGPDAYYRIYGHRYLLTHGDQFRGGDGMIGALGPLTRGTHKKSSRNAQIDMNFDTMICGHWHQYIHLTKLIVNGSLKGYDEYAYNNNFPFEEPQQALWLTHPKYRITYRMPVKVDRQRQDPKTAWASVATT
jgi:hypothetical protein